MTTMFPHPDNINLMISSEELVKVMAEKRGEKVVVVEEPKEQEELEVEVELEVAEEVKPEPKKEKKKSKKK